MPLSALTVSECARANQPYCRPGYTQPRRPVRPSPLSAVRSVRPRPAVGAALRRPTRLPGLGGWLRFVAIEEPEVPRQCAPGRSTGVGHSDGSAPSCIRRTSRYFTGCSSCSTSAEYPADAPHGTRPVTERRVSRPHIEAPSCSDRRSCSNPRVRDATGGRQRPHTSGVSALPLAVVRVFVVEAAPGVPLRALVAVGGNAAGVLEEPR